MQTIRPSFFDYFKSFYYETTYLPAVDLSDEALSKHLMEKEDQKIAKIAQNLISQEGVKDVLSSPLSYDMENEVPKNNKVLEEKNFKLLSSKIKNLMTQEEVPFYSVVEHEDLKGWVIKSGANRIPKDQFMLGPLNDMQEVALFTEEESLLRIEMAKRIQEVAKKSGFKDVIVPKKKLVAYAGSEQEKDPTRKYCVLCEKIDVLSVDDTVEAIKQMNEKKQIETAKKIATIVKEAGLVDASFNNIRLTEEGKIVFLDTEPGGLMVAKKPGLWNEYFDNKGASVEKCARIGLFMLMSQTTKMARKEFDTSMMFNPQSLMGSAKGLEAFHSTVEKEYKKAIEPQLSLWKIGLSIASFGLIAVVNAIVSLVKIKLIEKAQKELIEKTSKINPLSLSVEEQKQAQKESAPILKRIYAHLEGVPFKPDMSKMLNGLI